MKNKQWLDEKIGKYIGRVYMLMLLFISNVLMVVGATIHYLYDKSIILLAIGLISTIICIGVLSKPVKL